MLLDMRTLWMVILVTYALTGTLQLVLWRLQPRERAMLCWGLSMLSGALGAWFIMMRGVLPDSVSIGLGNGFTAINYTLSTAGLLLFARKRVNWWWIVMPAAVVLPLYTQVPLFSEHAGPRVLLMALLLGAVCVANLLISWRAQQLEALRLRQIAMAAFALTLAFTLTRATLTVFYTPPADFMAPQAIQPTLMFLGIALILLWNITVMLMPSERLQNQLRRAAQDDALTNLLNRGGFNTLSLRALARCRHMGQPVSVLLMDLDHFKRVNDTHGHEAGDRLLCSFAETVRAQSRASDLVARYGGEEFSALLPNADRQQALVIAERIRYRFERVSVPVEGGELGTTVSIGVAEIGAQETVEAALQRADQALYTAKREGRNRITLAPLLQGAAAA